MTESEALEIARKTAIEQIQNLDRALEESQPLVGDGGAGQRRAIIEAGQLLVAIMNNEAVARQKIVAKNMAALEETRTKDRLLQPPSSEYRLTLDPGCLVPRPWRPE